MTRKKELGTHYLLGNLVKAIQVMVQVCCVSSDQRINQIFALRIVLNQANLSMKVFFILLSKKSHIMFSDRNGTDHHGLKRLKMEHHIKEINKLPCKPGSERMIASVRASKASRADERMTQNWITRTSETSSRLYYAFIDSRHSTGEPSGSRGQRQAIQKYTPLRLSNFLF